MKDLRLFISGVRAHHIPHFILNCKVSFLNPWMEDDCCIWKAAGFNPLLEHFFIGLFASFSGFISSFGGFVIIIGKGRNSTEQYWVVQGILLHGPVLCEVHNV